MDIGFVERNPQQPPARVTPPQAPAFLLGGGAPSAERRAAAEMLDEIRQYHQDLYARRDVIAQTRTTDGDALDWVPVEAQVDGTVAEPPASDDVTAAPDTERPSTPVPPTFRTPDAEQGPPGTVPLVRKPVDVLYPVGHLTDYLSKGPYRKQFTPPDNPIPPATGADHKYAHAFQQVTCFGTEGTINTWKPYVQWSNEFSLGQLWLVRGSGSGLQTLECGAQTYKDLYGDWSPHLFVFFTTNGYTQMGNAMGGYNTDVTGWVQVGTSSFPGMRVAESVAGGDQYDLAIKVQLFDGNWWIRVGAEWMGYYPASLYSSTGLGAQADSVDWGGEIVDDSLSHAEPTSTWMGSGGMSASGWGHAAYMRNLSYQSDVAGTVTSMLGSSSVTNPAAYDITTDFTGSSAWGSYFYWGGPGGVA